VAPEWAQRLPAIRELTVIGLTMDSALGGSEYFERFGIEVPVVSIDRSSEWFRRGVGGRTPMLLLIDSIGVLRFRGHGGQLPLALAYLEPDVANLDGSP
jgi:hypothetical protein